MKDTDKAFWVRSEEGEPFKKCGDCIHADVCELNPFLQGFSRDSAAYCGAFKNREEYVEVVRCCDCRNCTSLIRSVDSEVLLFCEHWKGHPMVDPTDFCSYGERRNDV